MLSRVQATAIIATIALLSVYTVSARGQEASPSDSFHVDQHGIIHDATGRDVGIWGVDDAGVLSPGTDRYTRPPTTTLGFGALFLFHGIERNTRVAVVVDAPSSMPGEYVSNALAPKEPKGLHTGISADLIAPKDLTAESVKKYDQFMLVDIAKPTAELAELLERRVKEGAGLCVFLGPSADAALYRRHFYRMGRELLPAPLAGIVDQQHKAAPIAFGEHGFGESFRNSAGKLLLKRVTVAKYRAVPREWTPAEQEGVAVVARLGDAPLILQRRLGKGRVVAIYTSPDAEWTDWMTQISWKVLLYEIQQYLAGREEKPAPAK